MKEHTVGLLPWAVLVLALVVPNPFKAGSRSGVRRRGVAVGELFADEPLKGISPSATPSRRCGRVWVDVFCWQSRSPGAVVTGPAEAAACL